MNSFLVGVLLSSVVITLGCGSASADDETLSIEDVTGLPPGNAVGTSFSGTYLMRTSKLLSCNCREGSCSNDVRATQGGIYALTHTDGALTIVQENAEPTPVVYTGGIDGDGKFRVGASLVTESFTWFTVMAGRVFATTTMDGRTRATVNGRVGGVDLDCDVEVEFQAPHFSP